MFRYIIRNPDGSLAATDVEEAHTVSGLSEVIRYTASNNIDTIRGYAEAEEEPPIFYLVYRYEDVQSATEGAVGWLENITGQAVAREDTALLD